MSSQSIPWSKATRTENKTIRDSWFVDPANTAIDFQPNNLLAPCWPCRHWQMHRHHRYQDGMRKEIDRDKARAAARKLDGTGLRVWLDRAIDMLPDEAFSELIADYVHLKDVLADERTRPDLLRTIRQFHRDSLAGRYYQDFMVNSRNFMEMSRGTEIFIAEHSRLVEACLRAEQAGDLETAAEGLGLLIDLMREIDCCQRDITFFADEPGSWQVGVIWEQVHAGGGRGLSRSDGLSIATGCGRLVYAWRTASEGEDRGRTYSITLAASGVRVRIVLRWRPQGGCAAGQALDCESVERPCR